VDPTVAQILLDSIQEDKLVFLCGAGLSMAAPSGVPSAAKLAEECSREYDRRMPVLALPPDARANLENLARFFLSDNRFSFLIHQLVRWEHFCGDPNEGHKTVADLITCGASLCAVTTNFDILIERAAEALGERTFTAALDGDEANVVRDYRTLLKIHGCFRQRDYTLWCYDQLDPARTDRVSIILRERTDSSRRWLQGILPERQLVVIGFWSDWRYLNTVLVDSVKSIHPAGIIVVDPLPQAELQVKAPELWAWASGLANFRHIREKAEVFLGEFRELFSRRLLSRSLKDASDNNPGICGDFAVVTNSLNALDADDLYALRRDFAGVPSHRVARWKEPDDGKSAVALAHLRMLSSGARLDGSTYLTAHAKRVRIVNGRTRAMSSVRVGYTSEPARTPPDDYIVCAGVDSSAGHPSIIPKTTATIVRPGGAAEWISEEEARDQGIL
jgi:NAD-dependent SIR2 family protein deacetylase